MIESFSLRTINLFQKWITNAKRYNVDVFAETTQYFEMCPTRIHLVPISHTSSYVLFSAYNFWPICDLLECALISNSPSYRGILRIKQQCLWLTSKAQSSVNFFLVTALLICFQYTQEKAGFSLRFIHHSFFVYGVKDGMTIMTFA